MKKSMKHAMPVEALHTMGQESGKKVGDAFVTSEMGIPGAIVNQKTMNTTATLPQGTANLRNVIAERNK